MTAESIDWEELAEEAQRYTPRTIDLSTPAGPVSPKVLATREYGRVLHQIRTAVFTACLLMAGILAMSIVIADRLTAPGALVPSGPTGVQLVVTHDPAVEAWAHVTYADGTERDYPPGAYRGDGVVAVVFTVAADAGAVQTGCKIIVDNARVSEEIAVAGETATCRWSA